MQFEAIYYDGISARAKPVLVTVAGGRISGIPSPASSHATHEEHTPADEIIFDISVQECKVQTQLGNGNGKRFIDLPDDGRLETDWQNLSLLHSKRLGSAFGSALHYAETHIQVALIALVFTILISLAMLKYGVPVAAKYAALATPESLEKRLGKQTLDALDHDKLGYFQASKLKPERQENIEQALAALCKKVQTCPAYDLKFRSSKTLGANALALPGNFVVITDALVNLADNDDEITAVLAHELGHVKLRHALRQTLQGTFSGLIIVAITGDISSIAAGLPALVVNMNYSRDLETEADKYALESLKAACIPTKIFSAILSKLENSHPEGVSLPEIISSHPDTKARIALFDNDQVSCI